MSAVWRRLVALAAVIALAATGAAASASDPAAVSGTIVYDFGNRLELSDLDGTDERILVRTPTGRPLGEPVWSPDGTAIAFVRGGDVYVVRVADQVVTRVVHLTGFIGTPRWSPDGSRLAFDWSTGSCSTRSRDRALYVAAVRGNDLDALPTVLPAPPPAKRALFFRALGWSPDGKRLLYGEERWRVPGDCGLYTSGDLVRSSLFHVGIAGGRPTRIAAGAAGQGEWSPDGKFVVLCRRGHGVSVARTDGRVVRSCPGARSDSQGCVYGSASWMIWSRHGDEVYVATDDRVVALRVSDGRRRILLADPGLSCTADFNCTIFIHALSPDGRFLVVEAEGGEKEGPVLIAVSTDGKQHVLLPYPRHRPFAVFLT
jgi:hypothetical protein